MAIDWTNYQVIPELWVAAEWWQSRLLLGIGRAFPDATLFGSLADELKKKSTLEVFSVEFVKSVAADFAKRNVPWNPSVPLEGARMRKIGIEGAFRSEPLKAAMEASGYGEVIPFLPDGCVSIINPGSIFTAASRREKEVILEVAKPTLPDHLEGVEGYGI